MFLNITSLKCWDIAELYKTMILEKRFGLSSSIMAQKMIPSLAPQTVNPCLNVDQFTNLMEVSTGFIFADLQINLPADSKNMY